MGGVDRDNSEVEGMRRDFERVTRGTLKPNSSIGLDSRLFLCLLRSEVPPRDDPGRLGGRGMSSGRDVDLLYGVVGILGTPGDWGILSADVLGIVKIVVVEPVTELDDTGEEVRSGNCDGFLSKLCAKRPSSDALCG